MYIIDAPCGAGKTSAAIAMMDRKDDNRYLFVTSYLDEVGRIIGGCKNRAFYEPQEVPTKAKGIVQLLEQGCDIATTHALFMNFSAEIIRLIRAGGYTLVLDEVVSAVDVMDITRCDFTTILEKYAHVEDGLLVWDDLDYRGNFSNVMNLALAGCIGTYGNTAFVDCYPIAVFGAFKEVYVMTYMFDAQMQRYYFDFYGIGYEYLHVRQAGGNYHFTAEPQEYRLVGGGIDIFDGAKLNEVGDADNALSVGWFYRDRRDFGGVGADALRKNMTNYFRNIKSSPTNLNMWTTYKDYRKYLKNKGFAKGFAPINARATNNYRGRTCLAYCANIYMNPILKQFFKQHGVVIDEERYALSEMVQWVWRSAIRDGGDISIYIPSSRMREIFSRIVK
jgi:hypothetical protein